jgi:precorrin-6x reductase
MGWWALARSRRKGRMNVKNQQILFYHNINLICTLLYRSYQVVLVVTGEEWITGLCQLVAKKQKEINQLKETKKALVEANAQNWKMIFDLKEELERLKNAKSE